MNSTSDWVYMSWRDDLLRAYALSFASAIVVGGLAIGSSRPGSGKVATGRTRLWPLSLALWAAQSMWVVANTFAGLDLTARAKPSQFVMANLVTASIAGVVVLATSLGCAAACGRVSSWPRAASIVVLAWSIAGGFWAWCLADAYRWEARMQSTGLANNGLHQTRREGAAASRPVVEARLAGEAGCSTGNRWSRFTE